MNDVEYLIANDPAEELGSALAAWGHSGQAIFLTGGSSIARAYEKAAEIGDWRASTVWWGDERCVPPDDDRSNYLLAKRSLLDRLDRPPEVHRMKGELGPPRAAEEYEAELGSVELELLLLGMGPDGHVASLFSGSPQLQVRDRRVTSGPAGLEPLVDRVTLTLPTLLSARETWLLITGEAKAEMVARAFRGPITEDVPASLLRRGEGNITVFLDHAAASRILVAEQR
jgi:6-phosphogluconolactonase